MDNLGAVSALRQKYRKCKLHCKHLAPFSVFNNCQKKRLHTIMSPLQTNLSWCILPLLLHSQDFLYPCEQASSDEMHRGRLVLGWRHYCMQSLMIIKHRKKSYICDGSLQFYNIDEIIEKCKIMYMEAKNMHTTYYFWGSPLGNSMKNDSGFLVDHKLSNNVQCKLEQTKHKVLWNT